MNKSISTIVLALMAFSASAANAGTVYSCNAESSFSAWGDYQLSNQNVLNQQLIATGSSGPGRTGLASSYAGTRVQLDSGWWLSVGDESSATDVAIEFYNPNHTIGFTVQGKASDSVIEGSYHYPDGRPNCDSHFCDQQPTGDLHVRCYALAPGEKPRAPSQWRHIILTSTDQTKVTVDYPSSQTDGDTAWFYPVWVHVDLPAGHCNGPVAAQLISVAPAGVPVPPKAEEGILDLQVDANNSCHYSAHFANSILRASHAGAESYQIAIRVGADWIVDPAHQNDTSDQAKHNFRFSL